MKLVGIFRAREKTGKKKNRDTRRLRVGRIYEKKSNSHKPCEGIWININGLIKVIRVS